MNVSTSAPVEDVKTEPQPEIETIKDTAEVTEVKTEGTIFTLTFFPSII